MAIYQLIYYSTATKKIGEVELERLVSQARIYNFSQSITGVLFYAEPQFLQVLEGEQAIVEQLFSHISQDPRHTDVTAVLGEPTPQRLFPNWRMGFSYVAAAALTRLAAYLNPQHRAALLPSTCNAHEVITDLLSEFVEEQTMAVPDPRSASFRR